MIVPNQYVDLRGRCLEFRENKSNKNIPVGRGEFWAHSALLNFQRGVETRDRALRELIAISYLLIAHLQRTMYNMIIHEYTYIHEYMCARLTRGVWLRFQEERPALPNPPWCAEEGIVMHKVIL